MTITTEYDVKKDSKNRITVRKTDFDYFHVTEFDDGHLELVPRVLVHPKDISKNSLKMIDKSKTLKIRKHQKLLI